MSGSAATRVGVELERALARLGDDGLVAFPTETVWGLAARASSEPAVSRLRAWKGRDDDKPIAVMVSGAAALGELGVEVGPVAQELMGAFWPGPLTLVMPRHGPSEAWRGRLAPGVARDDGALGLRCSSHPVAQRLARAAERASMGPLTATSLNRSGATPARTRAEALAACGSRIDEPWALDVAGAVEAGGAPSTLVDLCGVEPRVLRWGAIDAEMLTAGLGRPFMLERKSE